ncbi:ABC transporter permease subunit [Nocardioides sp. zg-579]|uniref:ABC transporter permease subunit n=2 Tax=Nocardioides marmotae TaxID=2663857 RepID=A0A6I3J779_9ACTN|nr:ABC transporter permease subunit [Gordonia jinghuaiqii]MTB93739.1 ABC transporter permease subunit [Nocardioides marmotae]QKE03302.1 ABC transporter permease [Nocardioides marmotae]
MSLAGVAGSCLGVQWVCTAAFGRKIDLAFWTSVCWIGLIVLAAVVVDWLPLAEARDVSQALREPLMAPPDLLSRHPLGTDNQGLDILAGIIYGARVSLVVSVGATLIGMVVGGLIGIMAGWFGGKIDFVVRLLTDSMLAFPPLILLLAMVAILRPSVLNVTLALGVLGIPLYIRLARVAAMVVAPREYVLAAKTLGARSGRIMARELLPNVALPVLSYGFIVVGVLIVAEASLSFLGLSIARPTPTWGNMIAAGQNEFQDHPHLVAAPGIVLAMTVYAINIIGERMRAKWDPRQNKL